MGEIANMTAFLDMIAWSELGQSVIENSQNGYDVLVGSLPGMILTFSSYERHPGTRIYLNETLSSTAAGRYQIKLKNWRAYKNPLKLIGFWPSDQDKIARQLILECKAVSDIEDGNVESAIHKCRSRWASLTGAGYGQREHKMQDLLQAFDRAGGKRI